MTDTSSDTYPPELAAAVELYEDSLRSKAKVSDLVGWIADAVAAGVIGNATYATVVEACRRLRRPKIQVPAEARSLADAVLLATLALHSRCNVLGMAAPSLDEIFVREAKHGPAWPHRWFLQNASERARRDFDLPPAPEWPSSAGSSAFYERLGWQVDLETRSLSLSASVFIPDGPLKGSDIEIALVAAQNYPDKIKYDEGFGRRSSQP